jgi:hypothetical protein
VSARKEKQVMSRRKRIVLVVLAALALVGGFGGYQWWRYDQLYGHALRAKNFHTYGVRLGNAPLHQQLVKDLKAFLGGRQSAKAEFRQHVGVLASRVKHDREDGVLKDVPKGTTVQPLLESYQKYLDIQERVWVPEMKRILAMMDKDEGNLLAEARGALYRCRKAEKRAVRDILEKALAYEKEFESELRQWGARPTDPAVVGAARADGERDENAEQLAAQFAKGIAAKDLGGLLKIVAVPWYDNRNGTGRVLDDRDRLKKELQELLRTATWGTNTEYKVDEVLSYKELLDQHGGELKEETRGLLARVLKGDDRAVNGRLVSGNRTGRLIVLVGRRDGRDRVVGVQEP